MLIFIDESGDSGLKTEKGSSRYFTIGLVVFDDNDEALACDQRIQLLKKEIGWPPKAEFNFKRNSDRVRETFLKAVVPYSFFYYGVVINKDRNKLWGDGFRNKINREDKIIKKVKMQRSESNNLLQLADYVASSINRSIQNKRKKSDDYRRIISHREIYVQIWPKE